MKFRSILIVATVALLGSAGLASAAVEGQFGNYCAEGLALHQKVKTDCSVHTVIGGKTYCFGNKKAQKIFMMHPEANLKRAEDYYATLNK